MLQDFLASDHFGWVLARVIATLFTTLFFTKMFRLA